MDKKPPLRQVIYQELLGDILAGRLNQGEKLAETQLAERFHVSRTPIREALLRLEKEGFVIHSKDVGAVVRKISAVQIDETYDIVALLESHATRIAVTKMKDIDISFIKKLQQSMRERANEERFPDWVRLNAEFHDFFAEKCGNEKLRDTILDLRKSIYRVLAEGQSLSRHVGEYVSSHQRIIEAAAKRDSDMAAEIMNSHVLDTKKYVLEAFNQLNQAPLLEMTATRRQ
jgi:DNA-binding GntR family transcriptional regulator